MSSNQDPNFDKKQYWDRRKRGLRGQTGHAVVFQRVSDPKGEDELIPISGKYPPRSIRFYTHPPLSRANQLKATAYISKMGAGR